MYLLNYAAWWRLNLIRGRVGVTDPWAIASKVMVDVPI
jgi:hypothetical protein